MKPPRRPGKAKPKSMRSSRRPARRWTSSGAGGGKGFSQERSTGDREPITAASSAIRKGPARKSGAIVALFKEKNRVEYVGLRLWRLRLSGRRETLAPATETRDGSSTGLFHSVLRLIDRFDRDSESKTFHDRGRARVCKDRRHCSIEDQGPRQRRQLAHPSPRSSARSEQRRLRRFWSVRWRGGGGNGASHHGRMQLRFAANSESHAILEKQA